MRINIIKTLKSFMKQFSLEKNPKYHLCLSDHARCAN